MEKELPKRKPVRLHNFDYGRSGVYFITVCVEKRKNILSKIVGEGSPLPQLTEYGMIVDGWIKRISEKYQEVSVSTYVIMPNHIHLLLIVENDGGRGNPSPTVNNAIGWLKYHWTKDINQKQGTAGEKVFQRSFHDHIIRNVDDYNEIYRYVCENPRRWKLDKLYSE